MGVLMNNAVLLVRRLVNRVFVLLIILEVSSCARNDSIDNSIVSDNKLLIRAINQNCKYVLTTWWNSPKDVSFQPSYLPNSKPLTIEQQTEVNNSVESFINWKDEEYLLIPNWQKNFYSEQAILPPCYACRILSSAIHYGIFDPKAVGISQEEAVKKTVLLLSSLAKYHCSNSEEGWGNCWQGALWAEMLGMSALLMKEYLSEKDWTRICNVIRSECDYVIDYAGVQFYRNRQGNIIDGREGDSQAETVAWNATILALAMTVFPNDPKKEVWRNSFIELNVAAMTRPSDVYSEIIIDGLQLKESLGSNINDDGTVTNHGKLHIDYMASPIESFAESSIALSYADEAWSFDCLSFNVDKVFYALVDLDLGLFEASKAGHHFYERSELGGASCDTNMPEENEWGNNVRQANYYLVDTYVNKIGADSVLPDILRGNNWAHSRLLRIIEMIDRDGSGRIYHDGEEFFASGQLYAMACLVQTYALLNGDFIH